MSAIFRSTVAFIGFLGATLAVGVIGAFVSAPNIPIWYMHLHKPPFTPPGALFAPVWITLYFAMAIAAWLAWRTHASNPRSKSLRMWWTQLAANLSWTILFFGLHLTGTSLFIFLILLLAITLTMRWFYVIRPAAAWLLAPYLAWCLFAVSLNAGIWQLNR